MLRDKYGQIILTAHHQVPRKDGLVIDQLLSLPSLKHTTLGIEHFHIVQITKLSYKILIEMGADLRLTTCPAGNTVVIHSRP